MIQNVPSNLYQISGYYCTSHVEYQVLHQHVSDYQHLFRYEHLNVSRPCAFSLLPPLADSRAVHTNSGDNCEQHSVLGI
jgi:hypothetical protein